MPHSSNTVILALILVLPGLGALSACSKPTQVEPIWHEQSSASGPSSKILVSYEITGEQVDERTEIKTRRKNDTPLNFFRYDFDEYDEAAYLIIKSTVQLATDMFETGKD